MNVQDFENHTHDLPISTEASIADWEFSCRGHPSYRMLAGANQNRDQAHRSLWRHAASGLCRVDLLKL